MTWLVFTIGAIACFRVTRLVGWDDLTILPRRWVCGVGDHQHHAIAHLIDQCHEEGVDPWDEEADALDGPPMPITRRRYYLSKMIHCPWCVGFWISLAAALTAWLAGHCSLAAVIPVALAWSATVGIIAKNLDP